MKSKRSGKNARKFSGWNKDGIAQYKTLCERKNQERKDDEDGAFDQAFSEYWAENNKELVDKKKKGKKAAMRMHS